MQPSHQNAQLSPVTRFGQGDVAHVVFEIEIGILDPVGPAEPVQLVAPLEGKSPPGPLNEGLEAAAPAPGCIARVTCAGGCRTVASSSWAGSITS